MSDLLPCLNPECDGSGDDIRQATYIADSTSTRTPTVWYRVRCSRCLMCGPTVETWNEAARLWNALPRMGQYHRGETRP